jgi:hypothetical protein
MKYSPEAILQLSRLIKGNTEALTWLQKNNFPELILLHYTLEGDTCIEKYEYRRYEALKELIRLKQTVLVAFAKAMMGDNHAANWLVENKKYEWAAIVSIVNKKDKGAEAWLVKHKLTHFAELAKTLREKEEEMQEDDIFGLLKKLIPKRKNNGRRNNIRWG